MNEGEIDVSTIPPARLLAALYNRSHPQGMGFLHATPEDMTEEEAQNLLQDSTGQVREFTYFDYLNGRVMKVEINGEILNSRLYDRDIGIGAAQTVVDAVIGQKENL